MLMHNNIVLLKSDMEYLAAKYCMFLSSLFHLRL